MKSQHTYSNNFDFVKKKKKENQPIKQNFLCNLVGWSFCFLIFVMLCLIIFKHTFQWNNWKLNAYCNQYVLVTDNHKIGIQGSLIVYYCVWKVNVYISSFSSKKKGNETE